MQLLFLLLFIFSCHNDDIQHYKVLKPKRNNPIQITPSSTIRELTWDTPKGWKEKETSSSIRLAEFDIPFDQGVGDLSIVKLSSDGGGLEANINRWRSQLELEPLSLFKINELALTGKNKIGNFKWFKIIDENNNKAILGAIIPFNTFTYFIKLNTTKKGVDKIEPDFIKFCSSFKSIEKNN